MKKNTNNPIPSLIYGFIPSSTDCLYALNNSLYKVVGFISSESHCDTKENTEIPVYSEEDIYRNLLDLHSYNAVLIDPQRIERDKKLKLMNFCLDNNIELLSISDPDSKNTVINLHKATIEEILSRIPIDINIQEIGENLRGKTIMVTGAAGSIGSEIVRQLSTFDLGLLVLCDTAETPLHDLSLEMNEHFPKTSYIPKVGDIKDYAQMKHLIERYKPSYIYHAAAYKHVPLMENNPCEAFLTNVLGTKNIIDIAIENGLEVFVMVSTDKAVNPSNIMGLTKRIAEIYVQSLSQKLKEENKDIRIITTRFGNVLGSSGSVIPLFKKQIENGGPLTITHPDIIRYFMTIREASRLVLDASNFGKGGEVFLFDMGESIKIKDLAETMIRLSGLEPYKDIDILYTGLRPGEKLYEELLYNKEKVIPTHNRKILIGSVREYDYKDVKEAVDNHIKIAKTFNEIELVSAMKVLVPEYVSHNSIYSSLDKN